MKRTLITVLAAAAAFVPAASAQSDDEARARELIAKIKKEMRKIDELLLQVDQVKAAEAGETLEGVRKSIDELLDARELLENVTESQGAVIEGIDELARMTKYQKSNQSDPNYDDQQQPEQQRNRERERDQEPQDLKHQGEPKQQQQQQKKPGEQDQPQDGREDRQEPEQRDGQSPPPSETGRFENEDVTGRWGNLPPKVAEMFQQLGPEAFPVKYRKLLDQYYKKAARKND
ncbi:MAG: hypothetical protein ACF8XB_15145 [Planctomycetota bacterium JB042]